MQEQGTTIFLVSHSPKQVQNLCNRALVLKEGQLVFDGEPADAVRFMNDGGDDSDVVDEETDF